VASSLCVDDVAVVVGPHPLAWLLIHWELGFSGAFLGPSERINQLNQSFPLDRGLGNNPTDRDAYIRYMGQLPWASNAATV
jgi:hypothetical protein